jgi:hypothetical protein
MDYLSIKRWQIVYCGGHTIARYQLFINGSPFAAVYSYKIARRQLKILRQAQPFILYTRDHKKYKYKWRP